MSRATMTGALVLTLALFAACSNEPAQTAANQPAPAANAAAPALTPEQLGELGAQLRKDPARADEILAQRGLSPQVFEKAIRDVTENPEASKRYAAAYRKASA
ncbi:MAG TPA: hypothetical protein VEU30_15420 [Thermoanaerobaculia bacterium]|nr:hypothetical protein [Thermoanaerobaculia bacterium]